MVKQVLCTCVWCLQMSEGQGKSVSPTTRTRHMIKQKKTWPNPADLPVLQRRFGPSLVGTTVTLSISSQTSISALSESHYQRDKDYESDRDNREETETYNSMILSNDNDEIRILEDEEQKDNQIEMLGDEEEENDQIEMLGDEEEENDQIEMLEDEEEENDQIKVFEDDEEEGDYDEDEDDMLEEEGEYTGESENFGKLIKVHVTLYLLEFF